MFPNKTDRVDEAIAKMLSHVEKHLETRRSDYMSEHMRLQTVESHYRQEIFKLEQENKELRDIISNFSKGYKLEERNKL